jgi:hypothetical protein
VVAVGYIAVELMQKSPQENGKVGLERPYLWPHDAQQFVAQTTSLASANALSKVCGASIYYSTLDLTPAATAIETPLEAGPAPGYMGDY